MEIVSHSRMVCLIGSNYVIYKGTMQDLLCTKDLSRPLKGDQSRPATMSNEDWDILNEKTVATIRQWVDDSVYHHVSEETNAQALWLKLQELYERKTVGNNAFLI